MVRVTAMPSYGSRFEHYSKYLLGYHLMLTMTPHMHITNPLVKNSRNNRYLMSESLRATVLTQYLSIASFAASDSWTYQKALSVDFVSWS